MKNGLEKSDKDFLLVSSIISIICIGIISIVYFYFNKNETSFFLSVIGTAVTIVALLFSIYQQIKLKKTSDLINESTKKLYENIRSNYQTWSFNRAISLANEVEDALIKKEYKLSLILIRQLQDMLVECKKVYVLDFKKELYAFIKCMDEHKGKSFEQIIAECECKCENENLDKIKKLNKNISSEYVALNSRLSEKQKEIEIKNLANAVIRLRHCLTEIKPTPLNFVNV